MVKVDFKVKLRMLYKPPKGKLLVLEVPRMRYLMVEGRGDPDTSEDWVRAIRALYGVAYPIKAMMKKAKLDYVMPPLEAQWWTVDGGSFAESDRSEWRWNAMIMQPEAVTEEFFSRAVEKAGEEADGPALDRVRLEYLEEGLCAQVLHVGPYSVEAPAIEKLHSFIEEKGYERRGRHHEIYLTDPRRVKPERWRTVIRQPIGKG